MLNNKGKYKIIYSIIPMKILYNATYISMYYIYSK